MSAEPEEGLLLAGFVPVVRSGFALPCYAAFPGANRWAVARCSIDGDHTGSIVGFEPYEGDHVVALPERLTRRVRVGDPWIDVFLWDYHPDAGTAVELLGRMAPMLEAVVEQVPITALDLALAADSDDAPRIAGVASSYVEARHGAATAARWMRDTVTGAVRLAVRRRLAAIAADAGAFADAGRMMAVDRGASFDVALPATVTAALEAAEELEAARGSMRRKAALLGTRLRIRVTMPTEPPPSERAWHGSNKAWWPGAAIRMLVVVAGPRAEAVARHLSSPDWVPIPHAPEQLRRWTVRRERRSLAPSSDEASIIDVVSLDALPSSFDDYAVVSWLMDDGVVEDRPLDLIGPKAGGRLASELRAVQLLAPMLPAAMPSSALLALAGGDRLDFSCDAVIDTSLARSPFWTGNPDRAVDRRVADLVVATALLCAIEGPVRTALLDVRPKGGPRLVSVAVGDEGPDAERPGIGLASEISATGLLGPEEDRLDVAFGLTPLDRTASGMARGYASLRRPDEAFDLIAEAAVAQAASSGSSPRGGARRSTTRPRSEAGSRKVRRGAPHDLGFALQMPELTTVVEIDGRSPVLVTAEAPTLKAVRAAWSGGYAVSRYNDLDTLAGLVRPDGSPPGLPADMRLPELSRRASNVGLVVRGVDPRDVVRFPFGVLEGWRSQWGKTSLHDLARGYLARSSSRDFQEAAIPRAALVKAVASDDPAAVDLLRATDERVGGSIERPVKRPADLRAAWEEPIGGDRRFVIEDGRLPVEMCELPGGLVPAQRMFFVDGDDAVPLLFGSRPFGVWAQATTTRSTSWLPRFSIGRTFETLPIPSLFELVPGSGTRPRLHLAPGSHELAAIGSEIRAASKDGRPLPLSGSSRVGLPSLWGEVDRLVLDAIGLAASADDADILARLLERDRG